MSRVDVISSHVLSQITRSAISTQQKQLVKAQVEVATGRHADMGLALGSQFGTTIALRLQLGEVTNAIDRIAQTSVRAEITQASLSTLSELATSFQSMLSGARGAENGRKMAAAAAMSSLEGMLAALSATYDGQYVFGGRMTETAPLVPYSAGPQEAALAAFESTFGFSSTDPAAASLTISEIEGFLENGFSALFNDDAWTPTWSGASDESPVLRLGPGSDIAVQTNTNRPFARTLAQVFAMVEVLGQSSISKETFQAVADRALTQISEARLQIGAEQAMIGMGQGRLSAETETFEAAEKSFTSAIQSLENVDSYEAATRVNLLMTQLEASYALTGRISRMTLLSYI